MPIYSALICVHETPFVGIRSRCQDLYARNCKSTHIRHCCLCSDCAEEACTCGGRWQLHHFTSQDIFRGFVIQPKDFREVQQTCMVSSNESWLLLLDAIFEYSDPKLDLALKRETALSSLSWSVFLMRNHSKSFGFAWLQSCIVVVWWSANKFVCCFRGFWILTRLASMRTEVASLRMMSKAHAWIQKYVYVFSTRTVAQ